jgi:hypothetical protein
MTEDSDTEPQVSAAVRPIAPVGPYASNIHDHVAVECEVDLGLVCDMLIPLHRAYVEELAQDY